MPSVISIIELVTALIGILLVSAVVLALCKRIKMPFTVALVLVGMAITNISHYFPAEIQPYFSYHISPDLIFYVCLPTLLFESAFALDPRQLKRNLSPILMLAIPGLLISTGLIGMIVYLLTPIGLAPALLLGAILSATDPIAVIALFKSLGAPKRLTVLVEGESLFNDATSIVAAKLLFTVVIAGMVTTHDITHGIYEFFVEFFGGILVGWLIALFTGNVLGFVESDPEIEISLTTILAYATFLIAQEMFHVSGVMATVAAGLTLSGWGRAKISPSVHTYLEHFWEFLAYIANALIFLLVGLSVNLSALWNSMGMLVVAIMAMLVSRAVITFGLIPMLSRLPGAIPISKQYQAAIYWGGLRGAIALAIVLSLPPFAHKDLFVALVTGAVLFTLIVNGLTMEKLVRWLKLDQPPLSDRLAYEEGQLAATKKALSGIPELQQGGLFSARIAGQLQQECQQRIDEASKNIDTLRAQELDEAAEEKLLVLRSLAAEKHLYYTMFAKGHLTENTYRILIDIVINQIDLLRYSKDAYAFYNYRKTMRTPIQQALLNVFNKLPILNSVASRKRARIIAQEYEQLWGQYQGYIAVLKHLEQIIEEQPDKRVVAQHVYDHFAKLQERCKNDLDAITEQFPEFVTSMQERLANRLILQAEHDALTNQVQTGTLPAEVAKKLQHNLESKMYKLRATAAEKIELDPNELLRKVPFFKDIPETEIAEIQNALHPLLLNKGEAVIKEGESGPSMFLIMRGVVRVSKNIDGKEVDLTTLFAGDFFGESAMLHEAPRNATCTAATPCSLFELKRSDFEKVMAKFPAVAEAIETADRARIRANIQQGDQ